MEDRTVTEGEVQVEVNKNLRHAVHSENCFNLCVTDAQPKPCHYHPLVPPRAQYTQHNLYIMDRQGRVGV